ncbi:MAG: isoleucine--tRNA ligase [Bacteroidota bacterium]
MSYTLYKQLNLPQVAQQTLAQWKENQTFEQSVKQNKDKPQFNFYEGPPSANGKPGIHHALSRTLKDTFCRYKTMQGFYVPRQAGWDTHGLPIELKAEKELNITKEDIGQKISIEEYNAYCRKIVLRFQQEWNELTERIGYWADIKKPYLTCDNEYISTVWGLLKRLHQKKLLYKGYSIQPYSPAAGTGLSTHELNQPGCYKMVKDTTIVAQFAKEDEPNTFFLAWTTTPWTLPANTALALNAHIAYQKIKTLNRYTQQPIHVILAKKAVARYFDAKMENTPMHAPDKPQDPLPWQVVEEYQGKQLAGIKYEPLMSYIPVEGAYTTVTADFVTTEDGTGIVHIAPTFGQQDFQLAQQKNIPSVMVTRQGKKVPIVDPQGRFVEEITDFAHQYVKSSYKEKADKKTLSVDIQIAQKLKKENKAFLVASYQHSYPHCWRTDKPVLYYPLDAWFIQTTTYKKQLVAKNKTIHWQPQATGIGRFQNWLENLLDWNISRSRFWGTPLPIWRTQDGQEEKCIGSLQELRQEIQKAISAGFMPHDPFTEKVDLHRPYVDDIILCSPQGQKMYRESDVIDVWFDSGAMPYAAKPHIPLDKYAQDNPPNHYPATFIAEGVDQTRGWFFTLHTLAVMLFDSVAFKNVLSCGLLLDKHGQKMSKRLGNTINPLELIEKVGPDPIRWYMLTNTNPWENLKFDLQGVEEAKTKFFGTLHNTYQFFALYANIDKYEPSDNPPDPTSTTRADQWILSRLQHLIQTVTNAYQTYSPTPAARALQHFVIEELSNWYVRLNRKRFWVSEATKDKNNAYHTLHTCLRTVAQLAAPIAPFYMDRLYQDLHQGQRPSVHLTTFPQVDKALLNPSLEKQMEKAQKISSLVHALRKKHTLKVRLPLQRILLPISDNQEKATIQTVEKLILSEVNVKEIDYVEDQQTIVHKRATPNFQVAGKKYGPKIQALKQALEKMDQAAIQTLEKEGKYHLELQGETLEIPREDIILTNADLPGWATASEGNLTVALDLTVTPTLQAEGWSREVVNKIQNLRKAQGLAVEDKITLQLATSEQTLKEALQTHENYLINEVQALTLTWKTDLSTQTVTTIEVDGHTLKVHLKKSNP